MLPVRRTPSDYPLCIPDLYTATKFLHDWLHHNSDFLTMPGSQYNNHLQLLDKTYQDALTYLGSSGQQADAVLLHSGSEQFYYADDRGISFRSYGHFSHWLPLSRPDQMVLIKPGSKPIYFQVIPDDYWYEQSIENANWWSDHVEIVSLTDPQQVAALLGQYKNPVFLGENSVFAASIGFATTRINPAALIHYLDFQRALKSDYEVTQLRAANQKALKGHEAARSSFEAGGQ